MQQRSFCSTPKLEIEPRAFIKECNCAADRHIKTELWRPAFPFPPRRWLTFFKRVCVRAQRIKHRHGFIMNWNVSTDWTHWWSSSRIFQTLNITASLTRAFHWDMNVISYITDSLWNLWLFSSVPTQYTSFLSSFFPLLSCVKFWIASYPEHCLLLSKEICNGHL